MLPVMSKTEDNICEANFLVEKWLLIKKVNPSFCSNMTDTLAINEEQVLEEPGKVWGALSNHSFVALTVHLVSCNLYWRHIFIYEQFFQYIKVAHSKIF